MSSEKRAEEKMEVVDNPTNVDDRTNQIETAAEDTASPSEKQAESTKSPSEEDAGKADTPVVQSKATGQKVDGEAERTSVPKEAAKQEGVAKAENAAAEKPTEKECPKNLDLAFAMDCTGSMGSYITKATQSIRTIVEEIVSKEAADVRLALVQYRDHPPQDSSFVTKTNDFTQSVRKMKGWLEGCSASGGGDCPEAVADALHQVLKLSWRDDATRICIFIADAPPHGLGCSGDGFPNGCPDGLDPMHITNQLAEKGVLIYMVGCEPSITPYRDFFMALTHITGGQYVPLAHAKVLPKVIIGGAQEEISLEQLANEVSEEVMQEFEAMGEDAEEVDLEVMTKKIHTKMASRGVKSKQLHRNAAALPKASTEAQKLTSYSNMKDVKKNYKPVADEYEVAGARRMRARAARGGKPAPEMSKKKGGFFSKFSLKKKKSSKTEDTALSDSPDDDEEEDDEDEGMVMNRASESLAYGYRSEDAIPPPSGMAAIPGASSSDSYNVVEDDLCYEQTSRMVNRAVYKNKMQTKVKKAS